jgi:isochorismate hydrolase
MLKEDYFTSANIEGKAAALLKEIPQKHREGLTFRPEQCTLLVLDMQEYFLQAASHAYVPSAKAILPGLRNLIETWAGRGLPVIFTRHVNTDANAGGMAGWWRELLREENPLSAITPLFDTSAGEVIQKCQYDAFYGTELESRLHTLRKTQVVISGVMTHLCCETTARSAFMRGFEIFFAVDGTATYNEAFHRAALTNLAHGFATLTLVSEVMAALRARGEE